MSFGGTYYHRVDPQGRVAVPSRFRSAFKGGLAATKGYEPCIAVFTPAGWESFSERISANSYNQVRGRRLRRMAFGGVFYLELDRQGRALLPAPLRLYAGITDEVVIVGANEYMELWNTQRWDQEMVVVEESAWHIAETSEEQR